MIACNPLHGNPLAGRDDLARATQDLFAPLKPWFSPGRARVQLGAASAHYSNSAAELESFARPLWGILPLIAGGYAFDDLDLYLAGITAGTDPKHPEYWGAAQPQDQRMVEMAVFGFALLLAPDKLWHPLTAKTQQNLTQWLLSINAHPTADSNWLFFRILVNLGLRNVGAKYSESALQEALLRIERFSRSNGWYLDGASHQLDYYIPFAMHYYGLIVARLAGDHLPDVAARYRERAHLFAQDFQYWFGADGAAVPFGRSMTYRFAQGAFWSAAAFDNQEVLPWGQVKGLLLRHLRWWSDQPIADRDGVLSVGYSYPNLFMSEQYNATGSPYWAMKAFIALATPADHPLWTSKEEPAENLPDGPSVQVEAGMLARRSGGEAVLLNAGQDGRHFRQSDAKYGHFAYSSVFAFSVPSEQTSNATSGRAANDSTLAVAAKGMPFRARGGITTSGIVDGMAYGMWQPFPGTDIETWLDFAGAGWHVRVHRIRSTVDLALIETGFALDSTGIENTGTQSSTSSGKGYARAKSAFGTVGLIDLDGSRRGWIVQAWPNTNLRFPRTIIPALTGRLPPGEHLLVTAASGTKANTSIAAAPEISAAITTLLDTLRS